MYISKSFISGLTKSLNLFPTNEGQKREKFNNGMRQDYLALRGDWCNVGNDIRKGIERFRREEYRG